MTGAPRGSNVAEQLAAMQLQAEAGTKTATDLGVARAKTVTEREAALAKNAQLALKDYNDLGIQLGTLSAREQDARMLGYTGELGYDATMGAAATNANALLKGNEINAYSYITGAEKQLEGAKYNADKNLLGSYAGANATTAAANASSGGAYATADAMRYAADRPYADPEYREKVLNPSSANLKAQTNSTNANTQATNNANVISGAEAKKIQDKAAKDAAKNTTNKTSTLPSNANVIQWSASQSPTQAAIDAKKKADAAKNKK
jgi:hypothetical protein